MLKNIKTCISLEKKLEIEESKERQKINDIMIKEEKRKIEEEITKQKEIDDRQRERDFILKKIELENKRNEKKLKSTKLDKKMCPYLKFLIEKTEDTNEGHLHCTKLFDSYKLFYANTNINIPSYRKFLNYVKKHKEITRVRVKDKSALGIKNIKII